MAKKKAKKKKSGQKSKLPGKTKPAASGAVRVRMYCQGLGDCFLLTFPQPGGRQFNMLIDCGVILGTPDADARITQVAEHLAHDLPHDEQDRPVLDLLVATHEHWDHISGFVQAKEVFERFAIQQTWLAWTEDPADELASRLRRQREEKKNKLALAIDYFRQRSAESDEESPCGVGQRLASLVSFLGVDGAFAAAAGMGRTAQAMEFLQGLKPRYLKPGEPPPSLAGLPGVEIFVLGPPRDEKLLKKDKPTKKGREVYEDPAHGHGLAPLFGLDVPDETGSHKNQPFETRYSLPLSAALADPYYAQMYDNGLDEHAAAWRRIDDVGMFAAADLALQLDADTNNTSLALAIRLPGGQVLLFPGDAQVGNWESWHEIDLHDQKTKAEQLLAATVVYKVGHHGSHNATLSTLGLELMNSPDLLALLPVDEDIAHNNKGWLRMPFVPLMTELCKRTRGRILRVDHEVPHPYTDPPAGSKPTWTASSEKFTTPPTRSLYLETEVG